MFKLARLQTWFVFSHSLRKHKSPLYWRSCAEFLSSYPLQTPVEINSHVQQLGRCEVSKTTWNSSFWRKTSLVSNFVKNFVFCNDLLEEAEPLYALTKQVKISDPRWILDPVAIRNSTLQVHLHTSPIIQKVTGTLQQLSYSWGQTLNECESFPIALWKYLMCKDHFLKCVGKTNMRI